MMMHTRSAPVAAACSPVRNSSTTSCDTPARRETAGRSEATQAPCRSRAIASAAADLDLQPPRGPTGRASAKDAHVGRRPILPLQAGNLAQQLVVCWPRRRRAGGPYRAEVHPGAPARAGNHQPRVVRTAPTTRAGPLTRSHSCGSGDKRAAVLDHFPPAPG